jgi:hypothetical protein
MRTGVEEKLQGRRKISGAMKNYRGEEKITVAKKILLKVYQLSLFLDFNTAQGATRGLGTRFSFRLSIQKLAPGPGQQKPRTPPTDASHAAGRVGGGRSSCGARRSRAGIGARQPLTSFNLCGLRTRTRRGGDDGRARGAWRLDGGAQRVETIAPSSPPPVLLGRRPTSPCNAPTLPCHRARRGGVGDAGGTEPACTDAPDGARPRGERKDALDTVA